MVEYNVGRNGNGHSPEAVLTREYKGNARYYFKQNQDIIKPYQLSLVVYGVSMSNLIHVSAVTQLPSGKVSEGRRGLKQDAGFVAMKAVKAVLGSSNPEVKAMDLRESSVHTDQEGRRQARVVLVSDEHEWESTGVADNDWEAMAEAVTHGVQYGGVLAGK